jgi:hypothetical protein
MRKPAHFWTKEEIALLPKDKNVTSDVLKHLCSILPHLTRDQIWGKLNREGYKWVKQESNYNQTPTEDNPYPNHGKPWTKEEIDHFPQDKVVTQEILDSVCNKIYRKPGAIWKKMTEQGYSWHKVQEETQELSNSAQRLISFLHELGFRAASAKYRGLPNLNVDTSEAFNIEIPDHRQSFAKNFHLPEDFNNRQLYYALGSRLSALPWDATTIPEVLEAQGNNSEENVRAAAIALKKRLEDFLNA